MTGRAEPSFVTKTVIYSFVKISWKMTFLGHLAEAKEMINMFALGFIKKSITLVQRGAQFLRSCDLMWYSEN